MFRNLKALGDMVGFQFLNFNLFLSSINTSSAETAEHLSAICGKTKMIWSEYEENHYKDSNAWFVIVSPPTPMQGKR